MGQGDGDVVLGGRDGPPDAYLRRIQAVVGETGLAERVRFADDSQDMPAVLKLADVVALPATEPLSFARSIVAAQAMGKPVIVTNVGALPETMMPAATGWLVPPDDIDELARALDLALSLEDAVKDRLARRAREFVQSEFDVERSCRLALAVYRELLRRVPLAHAATSAS